MNMDNISKFYADAQRIKKHYRAEHSSYDGGEVCGKIKELFGRNNGHVKSLALSYADYWYDTYIMNSEEMENEPTEQHLQVLGSIQALIDNDPEQITELTQEDWKELCDLTNYEADDLPLEFLNDIMIIFVDHQAC